MLRIFIIAEYMNATGIKTPLLVRARKMLAMLNRRSNKTTLLTAVLLG